MIISLGANRKTAKTEMAPDAMHLSCQDIRLARDDRDKIAIHRVLIDVDLDLAHVADSAAMLLFEGRCLSHLGFKVCVDLRLVGVVVSKSCMNLRQRQVAKLPRDFFWNQA